MANIIVSNSVWIRVQEYYNNVSSKYPNAWDINDTIEQINKIQQIVSNFENLCVWSRDPKIAYWKHMGWRETWQRGNPWHFAFEQKNQNNDVYIFIQDAEHGDDIRESKNKIILKESQLCLIICETLKRSLHTK
ncbi:MAG: hypothetical protein KBT27_06145 [Prevotellaceae bacterium]|nr:hypothetical protein [Candidatus Faecinaster equi]